MKLPYYHKAEVSEAKVVKYLLSETHERGRSKQQFFARFGFSADEWTLLRRALLDHAKFHEVSSMTTTAHGVKYIIDGELSTPDGRDPVIRAVWIIEHGETIPHFVTAHPIKR